MYKKGEVWYAKFPLEDDSSLYIERPVLIADVIDNEIVVIKVTKHEPREYDMYDVPIQYWKAAGLSYSSTARISKVVLLNETLMLNKKGELQVSDFNNIFDKLNSFLRLKHLVNS